jgi:trk system potassium uptake protein TrkA
LEFGYWNFQLGFGYWNFWLIRVRGNNMYVIVVGCGYLGAYLSNLLSLEGHNIVVIDKNPSAFERLGKTFNGITMAGDAINIDVLKQAGIENADAFYAVTDNDNANIMASQIAKNIFKINRCIARIYDPGRASMYQRFGLDVVSGTVLLASMMRDKLKDTHLSDRLIESEYVGVLEFNVDENLKGRKVEEINITGNFLICVVEHLDQTIIPEPSYILEQNDRILAVVKIDVIEDVRKKLGIS